MGRPVRRLPSPEPEPVPGQDEEAKLELVPEAGAFDTPKEEDHRFENQGVAVVVDKTSMQFVFGSEVDWVDGLQGAGFSVNNPNVVAACGCGSSFQVREDAAEQAATV